MNPLFAGEDGLQEKEERSAQAGSNTPDTSNTAHQAEVTAGEDTTEKVAKVATETVMVGEPPAAHVRLLPGHRYAVHLPGETTAHMVRHFFVKGSSIVKDCSCTEDQTCARGQDGLGRTDEEQTGEEQTDTCSHRQAVNTFLEENRRTAARRRTLGLTYTGIRIAGLTEPIQDGAMLGDDLGSSNAFKDRVTRMNISAPTRTLVEVWEGERSQLLDPGPSQHLFNHSPTGFEWGYSGSGPAQLALAILLDYTGEPQVALEHHQGFKTVFIASLERDTPFAWEIRGRDIEGFLEVEGWQAPPTPASVEPPAVEPRAIEPPAIPSPDSEFERAQSPSEEGVELEYAGYYGAFSRCRAYFRRVGGRSVLLLSDVPEAPGTSVTNRIETVATIACLRFRIEPSRLVLLQYHPPTSIGGESFAHIIFRQTEGELRYPQWGTFTRQQATHWWGQRLPV